MKYITLAIVVFLSGLDSYAQEISGPELLSKSIAFHDPNGQWESFSGRFEVLMEMPDSPQRISTITIDLPSEYFKVIAKRDSVTTEYTIDKGNCSMSLNGNSNLTKAELFEHNLSCERANLYKNYYTYLYGLPMKLNDPGTQISNNVERKTFKGKEYLVLKVTYAETVGSDIWYFYFDPETYAMEIYQFFKTDEKGQMKPKSGEFILLSEYETIEGIKMPKVRAWYYNKDDSYLATDILRQ